MTNPVIDPEAGRWWAAQLEEAVGHWWVVVWALQHQHFAAFYRGHWEEGGVYRTSKTPAELWSLMREVQHEGRLRAMAARAPVPPLLVEQIPDVLRRADG